MVKITKEIVLGELSKVRSPDNDNNIVDSGIVTSVMIQGNNVGFVINVNNSASKDEMESLRKICEATVLRISGVEKVTAVLTSEHEFNDKKSKTVEKKPAGIPEIKPPAPKAIPGIKKIIAVASGKGGVGKSTIAAHLALALSKQGKKVGLVDADILGPSVAKMMNLSGEPKVVNNKMIPQERSGVKCMSMGLLLGENAPVIWRGPMVTKALHQLMLSCDWGELDVLVMDLPPGTGDIQLSLLQNYTVDGVILVSTPQEVALLDVKKGANMFRKLNIDIIGLIENMSYFEDSSGKRIELFGGGNCERYCAANDIKFLGKIPVSPKISAACDNGLDVNNSDLISQLGNIANKF